MKNINVQYWIVTALFGLFMMASAIPNIIVNAESVTFLNGLGYPTYIIPFLGVAKALGVIALLIPGYPRIKEWAYAGLFFDLAGATYSVGSVGGIKPDIAFMILPIVFLFLSYALHHKRLRAKTAIA
jgi:hypothetical protein